MVGGIPSQGFNDQLKKTVREMLRRERSNTGRTGRWHKKGTTGGGGGHTLHFTILEADCEGTGYLRVQPTEYTGGCSEDAIPGREEYTGDLFVRPFCGSPVTAEELVGTAGVAVYTYNLLTCERYWKQTADCVATGC